jgi:cyclopropane fatty-acyl-phospholipid synthase-like methyltransferase
MKVFDGGYDDGYSACPCFWGSSPGSLVKVFLDKNRSLAGRAVLDLGCGEGKNANAFALAGASVDAVDCSEFAISNGKRAFSDADINWIIANAAEYLKGCRAYDLIVMYGLLHCLSSAQDISDVIALALQKTVIGGTHIVVAFNDGPHDLSGHPNFRPTLVSHAFYCEQYKRQTLLSENDSILRETHPHNNIPHFHSISRLVVRVTNELS